MPLVQAEPIPLNAIQLSEEENIPTGILELDRVLGKGLVLGSAVLLSGEPGIGKSTLALQIAQKTAQRQKTILYISGEESVNQIYLRAKRLGDSSETLLVYAQINIIDILNTIRKIKPDIVILDSIQVVYHPDIPSTIGSVNQVRQCASELIQVLKEIQACGIIVGHITKDGSVAGPKVLEHLVDCILFFEGERHQKYRILRCFKNRFASTAEIGIFEMAANGLMEVTQASELFIDQATLLSPGSMVTAVMEGSRVFLVEIQALVVDSGYGMAKRTFSGVDLTRANLMIATLEKKLKIKLATKDIFLNIIGGLKVKEPALDLGMALAIISSLYEKALEKKIGVIGEVGLTGEIRAVTNIEKRILEFEKMGFVSCIVPAQNKLPQTEDRKIQIISVKTVSEACKGIMK